MAMTSEQRELVVQNAHLGGQWFGYVQKHSIAPGNYPLTWTAFLAHLGWNSNDPCNGADIATYAAAVKAGTDTLQA